MKNQTLKIIKEEIEKAEETLNFYEKEKNKINISYWKGYNDALKEIKSMIESIT